MSTFAVTVEVVGDVRPAENADRLDLIRLDGKDYDFIAQKGLYAPGDIVVYFPVDSLVPMWIVNALGLDGKLAHGDIPNDGSERLRNRVKTVKLRGNLSQGIVASPAVLVEANPKLSPGDFGQTDVTELLGVVKFEPPVVSQKHGNLVGLPDMVSTYDIEGAQNYPQVVDLLMNVPVCVSEKVEGSHWWASLTADGEFTVGQRNYAIVPVDDGEHDWHKVARLYNVRETLRLIFNELSVMPGKQPLQRVTLRAEIIGPGIQGNYYNTPDHRLYFFEIELNGRPVDASLFLHLCYKYAIPTPPVLAENVSLRSWLNGETVKNASNGYSHINPELLREGIVIKPMQERQHETLGRLFLKQRSPTYLAESDL